MRLVLVVLAVLAPAAVLACSGGAVTDYRAAAPQDAGQDVPAVEAGSDDSGDDAGVPDANAGQDGGAASDAGAADADEAGQLLDADASSPPDAASSTACAIYTNEPGIQCQYYTTTTGPYASEACLNPPFNMPPYEGYAVCPPSCTPPAIWAEYAMYNGDPTYCVPKCADADAGCAM